MRRTLFWATTFFLLSSFFRLSNLDLIEFKSDEATTVYQTALFFEHPYLIQRGLISGTGVYNFPLFNYLMIALAVWSRDPQNLAWIIALINSLLVGAFFLLVKRYYGILTALLASLILAFSPWGIVFSRKIWAQDLIFLFLMPYLFFLHELILKKNTKIVLPLFLVLALLIQFHGSGLFLFVTTIFILFLFRASINLKKAFLGILIGLIPALPYILFQINSYPQCPDCEAFLKYQQSIRTFDFYNFIRPLQIISGLGFHFVLGKSYADFITAHPYINLLKYVFSTGILIILIGVVINLIKRRNLLLVIYFIAIPLLYFITKTQGYMHYFVIIIPVSILLFALSISTFYQLAQSKLLKLFVVSYFVLFLVSNIIFTSSFYSFVSTKKYIEGDYGPIYSVTKEFIEKQTDKYEKE